MMHPGFRSAALSAAACAVFLASGCGGGGGGSTSTVSSPTPPTASNVVSVVVDDGPTDPAKPQAGPIGSVNTPFVTITLCAAGTANCQTIDHISVDTQSVGLRVISSVLSSSLSSALPVVTDTQSRPLAECLPFADGYSWGTVKQADLKIGGEEAAGISIEVIGDPALPNAAPDDCTSQAATPENDVTSFGANGILGVANFKQDCGSACLTSTSPELYFACTSSTCTSTTVALANQVWNPVALFATDNNGTILQLPSVGSAGAASVTGTLTFGIDTESNNALGTATVLTVDPNTGYLTVTLSGQSLPNSLIDSGSNGYFFPDSSLTQCKTDQGFYCPASTQSLSATLAGYTGGTSNLGFSVANAETLFDSNPSYFVFNDLGGTNDGLPGGFAIGLPFFLGRRVITSIEGMSTSVGTSPFVAF